MLDQIYFYGTIILPTEFGKESSVKRVLLGIICCLFGLAVAIISGILVCNSVLNSNLHETGLAGTVSTVSEVMLWSTIAIADVYLVIVPSLRLIQDEP